jgi:hypothetical protein
MCIPHGNEHNTPGVDLGHTLSRVLQMLVPFRARQFGVERAGAAKPLSLAQVIGAERGNQSHGAPSRLAGETRVARDEPSDAEFWHAMNSSTRHRTECGAVCRQEEGAQLPRSMGFQDMPVHCTGAIRA